MLGMGVLGLNTSWVSALAAEKMEGTADHFCFERELDSRMSSALTSYIGGEEEEMTICGTT